MKRLFRTTPYANLWIMRWLRKWLKQFFLTSLPCQRNNESHENERKGKTFGRLVSYDFLQPEHRRCHQQIQYTSQNQPESLFNMLRIFILNNKKTDFYYYQRNAAYHTDQSVCNQCCWKGPSSSNLPPYVKLLGDRSVIIENADVNGAEQETDKVLEEKETSYHMLQVKMIFWNLRLWSWFHRLIFDRTEWKESTWKQYDYAMFRIKM